MWGSGLWGEPNELGLSWAQQVGSTGENRGDSGMGFRIGRLGFILPGDSYVVPFWFMTFFLFRDYDILPKRNYIRAVG